MVFDYKKEYKKFYFPPRRPEIADIPEMNFLAVRGKGDPNEESGEYKTAVGLLYAVSYTIKMSRLGIHKIKGYFPYVVPPLEGLWWAEKGNIDYSKKGDFRWISLIRLTDFVSKQDFDWAIEEASKKKGGDFSKVEFFSYAEGLCIQCMHIGAYDNEPETISRMEKYCEEAGFMLDLGKERYHHEIYLGDPRKVSEEKLKTVIREPIRKKAN